MAASHLRMDFRQRLFALIDRSGVSDRRLSLLATGSPDTVRNLRRGCSPRLDSFEALCRVLGLQLQTEPLDEPGQPHEGASAVEKRPDWSRRLRDEIRQDLVDFLGQTLRPEIPAGTCQIEIRELSATADSGALDLDPAISGHLPFSRQWLYRHGLVPTRCTVIRVMGESMEPTLPEGASILIDRSSSQPGDGRIYVIRTSDGLVVKRVSKDPGGGWWLTSDHPASKPTRWPSDAEIIGEVRWVGRALWSSCERKRPSTRQPAEADPGLRTGRAAVRRP